MKPHAPTLSWLLLVSIWTVASITSLQEVTALEDSLEEELMRVHEQRQMRDDFKDDLIEMDQGKEFDLEFDGINDIEDDEGQEDEYDDNGEEEEEGEEEFVKDNMYTDEDGDNLSEDDLAAIGEVKRSLAIQRNHMEVDPGTTTLLLVGERYVIYSHDDFGDIRYPNRVNRVWYFLMGPAVVDIVVHCPFFRIHWSRRCRYDKFAIFKGFAYVKGIRRCGQIHGFWKKYTNDIKIVFKTNINIRRAGFCCVVTGRRKPPTTTTTTTSTTTTTFQPGCHQKPIPPANRTKVLGCADILPGFPQCECDEISNGLCLTCYVCNACDFDFFAVHDFSMVMLYIYIEIMCSDPIDITEVTYGFETSVKGYVSCFPPIPHVIFPVYPNAASVYGSVCPIPSKLHCSFFDSFPGRKMIGGPSITYNRNDIRTSANANMNFNSPSDFPEKDHRSFLNNIPQHMETIAIIDEKGEEFADGAVVDLTYFTSLQNLDLVLCHTALRRHSVLINSASIMDIQLILPKASPENITEDSIKYVVPHPPGLHVTVLASGIPVIPPGTGK